MFIVKLVYGDSIKKIKFLEEYKNVERLRQIIKDITSYENFQMSFIDLENEKLYLEDSHDMEYFLAQSGDQSKKIIIENNSEVQEDEFKEMEKSLEKSLEIQDQKQIEEDQDLLQEELKELIIGEQCEEQPQQEMGTPKIYQDDVISIKKVTWPKPIRKIKKQKTSTQMLNKLKKTMTKTENALKKKLSKMQQQIKRIEQAQKREKKQAESEVKQVQVIEQPTQHGIRVLTQHIGYVCDKCNQGPIVGIRYHCIVCSDYDLCQGCEQQSFHTHPMLRIINQQSKQQIEKSLNSYLDKSTVEEKMEVEEEVLDRCDQEKMDLLNFIFPIQDKLVQKELINRYRDLDIEQFYEEISKLINRV